MNTLLIGYDLNRPGQNYPDLIEAIKGLANGYWHHLDSTWIVRTALTAEQVRDALRLHIDPTDELLVITASAPAAWSGFNESGSAWLRKHL